LPRLRLLDKSDSGKLWEGHGFSRAARKDAGFIPCGTNSPSHKAVMKHNPGRLGSGWVTPLAQFPRVWETGIMAKRSLRVLKRVSSIPSRGVCEACQAQFSADPRQLGQAGVQQQFNAHKCDAAQNAAPTARETTKAGK